MESTPLTCSLETSASNEPDIGAYDCEIRLKFRLIEEKSALNLDRDRLLELLLEAFSYGADECLETLQSQVTVTPVPDLNTSPAMRRHLIRLRNSCP
jgi:hypothetical protein